MFDFIRFPKNTTVLFADIEMPVDEYEKLINGGIDKETLEELAEQVEDDRAFLIQCVVQEAIQKNKNVNNLAQAVINEPKIQEILKQGFISVDDVLVALCTVTKSTHEYPINEKLPFEVKKIYHEKEGKFVNLMNDLSACKYANTIAKPDEYVYWMAYAYARRTAAAGLFLQDILNKEQFCYQYTIWTNVAIKTDPGVDFQEEAARISDEIVLTYDKRFNKDFIKYINSVVVGSCIKNTGELVKITKYGMLVDYITAIIQNLKKKGINV